MKKINVGVIGLGVGRFHAINVLNNPNCNLELICDLSSKRMLKLPKELEKKSFTKNADDILLNKKIDLVCIASFDNYHFEHIIKALDNDKHVFVEKPICLNKKELDQIKKKLNQKKKLKFSSNLVLRNHPYVKKIDQLIKKKKLGKVYYVEAEYNYGRVEKIINGWRGQIKNYSIILGGGIHIIDIIEKIFNNNYKISNIVANKIVTNKSTFKNYDFATATFKYNSGLIVKLNFNFGCVLPHSHVFRVYGTNGTYKFDTFEEVFISKKKLKIKEYKKKVNLNHDYKKEILKSFIDHIKFNKKPIINKKNVLNSMHTAIKLENLLKNK